MKNIQYIHESGLVATYDFDDMEEVKKADAPIYIYKDTYNELKDTHEENGIVMSIEEAKWLIEKLEILIKNIE